MDFFLYFSCSFNPRSLILNNNPKNHIQVGILFIDGLNDKMKFTSRTLLHDHMEMRCQQSIAWKDSETCLQQSHYVSSGTLYTAYSHTHSLTQTLRIEWIMYDQPLQQD